MMPPQRSTAFLIAGVLLWTCSAAAAPAWQGHRQVTDGILTIYNPETPLEPPTVITPQELWRLGGDDSETIFGLVTDARPTADGTTFLLDAVLSTVYEVAPDGAIRRTLGREGDGPGEFRNAMSLALLPESRLGIVELMPSHMVVLGPDGLDRPGVDLIAAGRGNVQRVAVCGDVLVMGLFSMDFSGQTAEVARTLGVYGLDGSLRHRMFHDSEQQAGGSISISSGGDDDYLNNWSLGPDGHIAVYRHRNQYLIEVFDSDGRRLHDIRRKYETVRRPAGEIADMKAQQEQMRRRFNGNVAFEIDETAPAIRDVIARPDGRIWVLSSRGERDCPSGELGIFDVFAADGRFTSQLRLQADYQPDDDLYLVRRDKLYILKEAQNAPDRTFSGGGGQMMMVMSSGGADRDDEDEAEEARPYEVICYELPDGTAP